MSDDDSVRALLARLGAAMVATGQPVSDVEDELAEVGTALGYPNVQIAASPTGVFVNLTSGAPATFESVTGGLRLDQAAEVRAIRHRLSQLALTVAQATEELLDLRHRGPCRGLPTLRRRRSRPGRVTPCPMTQSAPC